MGCQYFVLWNSSKSSSDSGTQKVHLLKIMLQPSNLLSRHYSLLQAKVVPVSPCHMYLSIVMLLRCYLSMVFKSFLTFSSHFVDGVSHPSSSHRIRK